MNPVNRPLRADCQIINHRISNQHRKTPIDSIERIGFSPHDGGSHLTFQSRSRQEFSSACGVREKYSTFQSRNRQATFDIEFFGPPRAMPHRLNRVYTELAAPNIEDIAYVFYICFQRKTAFVYDDIVDAKAQRFFRCLIAQVV